MLNALLQCGERMFDGFHGVWFAQMVVAITDGWSRGID